MTDAFQSLALRLAAALGQPVDLEYFGADTCWSLVTVLELMMNEGRRLDPLVLRLLSDVSIELNARSNEPARYLAALEGQLGPAPVSLATIEALLAWGQQQLHFVEQKRPVALEEPAKWVPLRNLDYDK